MNFSKKLEKYVNKINEFVAGAAGGQAYGVKISNLPTGTDSGGLRRLVNKANITNDRIAQGTKGVNVGTDRYTNARNNWGNVIFNSREDAIKAINYFNALNMPAVDIGGWNGAPAPAAPRVPLRAEINALSTEAAPENPSSIARFGPPSAKLQEKPKGDGPPIPQETLDRLARFKDMNTAFENIHLDGEHIIMVRNLPGNIIDDKSLFEFLTRIGVTLIKDVELPMNQHSNFGFIEFNSELDANKASALLVSLGYPSEHVSQINELLNTYKGSNVDIARRARLDAEGISAQRNLERDTPSIFPTDNIAWGNTNKQH